MAMRNEIYGGSAGASSRFGPDVDNEKSPRWQLDLMMEKLRQKSSLAKPLAETAKNIRAALTVFLLQYII